MVGNRDSRWGGVSRWFRAVDWSARQRATHRLRPVLLAYLGAAACGVLCLGVGAVLDWVGGVAFTIPVALVATLSLGFGAGPGVAATALIAIGYGFFFIEPRFDLGTWSRFDTIRVLSFFVTSFWVIGIAAAHRRSRQRLRESEERFRRLAENSRDLIFRMRLHPTRSFEYVSPAATSLIGYTPEECYADPDLTLRIVHPDDRGRLDAALGPDFPGGSLETRWYAKDGRLLWSEQRVTVIHDEQGEPVAVEGIARDITERKAAEEALREADRRKDEFLAVLSHELRNPLSPILQGLYILDRTSSDSEPGKRAKVIIARQVQHMTRIIDDLLDVNRVSRGKIQLRMELLDLNAVTRRTVEDQRAVFSAAGIELQLELPEPPLWVNGDATRLAQVLGNLLHNARKFTSPGGLVSVALLRRADGWAELLVRDNGVGIDLELLDRLFRPFEQSERSLARSRGGLGLGLALVKGLVDLHGGTVAACSEGAGRGAEFTVRLPTTAAGPIVAADTAPETFLPRRVLVIEDNVDTAETLREALELQAHQVAVAYSGTEGLEQARRFLPDVILCDIGLPGMNGYEVAQAVRADPVLRSRRLVALTGYAAPEDRQRASQAGFDVHLAKPPALEELRRVLNAAP